MKLRTILSLCMLGMLLTVKGYAQSLNDTLVSHTVAPGETIFKICQKYKINENELRSTNPLLAMGNGIQVGQKVEVRLDKSFFSNSSVSTPVTMPAPVVSVTADNFSPQSGIPIVYRIRHGDTLGKIAARFRTSAEKIKQDNKLDEKGIKMGEVLLIMK
jgi:LysM repeat protein